VADGRKEGGRWGLEAMREARTGSAPNRPLACPQVFLTPIYLSIAMEFAPGGDMFEYVVKKNGLREDEARWFFQQLIVALDYCHKMVRQGWEARVVPGSLGGRCI